MRKADSNGGMATKQCLEGPRLNGSRDLIARNVKTTRMHDDKNATLLSHPKHHTVAQEFRHHAIDIHMNLKALGSKINGLVKRYLPSELACISRQARQRNDRNKALILLGRSIAIDYQPPEAHQSRPYGQDQLVP